MAAKTGLDCKLYRNTGNYATPVWNECKKVKDATLNLEKAKADVSTRGTAFRQYKGTLKDATITFGLMWDDVVENTEDYQAFKDVFFGTGTDEFIEVLALDGSEIGSEGLRATMDVTKFTRNEPLEEGVMFDVELSPTPSDNDPEWYTAAAAIP